MKMTRHNGRSGKNGTYNPKHNDRRFNLENSEHIDAAERAKQNIYWDIFNGYRSFADMDKETELADTFEDVEELYYSHLMLVWILCSTRLRFFQPDYLRRICGSVFRRRINITGKIRYPAWVCKEHIEHIENCSMRFIREDAIEWTFVLMMNKLIFAREKVLQDLQRNIRKETHKEIFRRVDEIDAALEKNREKGETLTTIMTKGYIEPAMFTREMNALSAEADALTDEREQLILSVDGDTKKAEALNEIIRFTGRTERLTEYDPEMFSAFVEQITVYSREELTFHLKCGLNLRERIVKV